MNPKIIFFPGWSGLPKQSYNPLLKRFEADGYETLTIPYPFGGLYSIQRTAQHADSFLFENNINHLLEKKLVFVGHSMGGLVARNLIQSFSWEPLAYISIATPHNGVNYYDILPNWGPFKAAKQMKAGSNYLNALNASEWPPGVNKLNLQASWDLLVPNKSSKVNWAENQKIPRTEHASILWSERTYLESWGFLNYAVS